jgi:formylglycine-generating enzyme required for sulfatase activity/predicted Ser/Thr protein kinase
MVIDRKYELQEKLGEGGMGSVFRARRLLIEDFVAIKFVRPEVLANSDVRQRFYQEAQVAARIKHPNVVTVHDFGETDDGLVYLVMEFLEGMSLGQLIKKNGPLALYHVLEIGIQICEALTCMLENNVIHRDLKPDNIMLVKDAQGVEMVKVVDFGVAKIVESNARLTRYKARIGSPVYSSPEQFLGKPVDHRTDLYGLGIIFYECLTGQVPFEALSEAELLSAIVHKSPPRLDEKINGFEGLVADLVHWLLAKDPNDRPYNAAQVGKCLQTLRDSKKTLQAYQQDNGKKKSNAGMALPSPRVEGQQVVDESAELPKIPLQDPIPVKPRAKEARKSRANAKWEKSKYRIPARRSASRVYLAFTMVGFVVMAALLLDRFFDLSSHKLASLRLLNNAASFVTASLDNFKTKSAELKPRLSAVSMVNTTESSLSRASSSPGIAPASEAGALRVAVSDRPLRSASPAVKIDSSSSTLGDRGQAFRAGGLEMLTNRSAAKSAPMKRADTKSKTEDKKTEPPKSRRARRAGSTTLMPAIPENLVWVKQTAYVRGDVSREGNANERPAHLVRVSDFLISRYEVTNKEYFAFVKETGKHLPEWIEPGSAYHYQTGSDDFYKKMGPALYGLDHPVVGVSWQDAVAYCEWLSQKKGSFRYRLPTEAEWELAAQGGKDKIKYSWGNTSPQLALGGNVADESLKEVLPDWPIIWRAYNDKHVYTAPVGSFGANTLGLYDMTGNVWEWCSDWYDSSYYKQKVMDRPSGPLQGTEHVIRGGSWGDTPAKLRISYRRGVPSLFRSNNLGFRVVATPR